MSAESQKLLEEKNTHLWFNGSPIVLCSLKLVLDIDEGGIFASAKWMNVQPEIIGSAAFDIICYDEYRKPIDKMENCIYHHIEVPRNGEFGEDLRFSIANTRTRNIEFLLKSVSTTKGQVWYNTENTPFNRSLEQKSIFDALGHLNKQFLDKCAEDHIDHTKLVLDPVFTNTHWLCACGCLNWPDESQCFTCGSEAKWLKENASSETLKAAEEAHRKEMDQLRGRYEEQQRQDKERQKAEFEARKKQYDQQIKNQKNQKAAKKILLILMIIIVLGAALGAGYYFGKPYLEYTSAVNNMNNGNFDEAMNTFQKMGDYKDSKEMYKKSLYGKAFDEMHKGNLQQAVDIFFSLGSYLDSYDQYCKTYEKMAAQYIERKDYASALEVYQILGEGYLKKFKEVREAAYQDAEKNLQKNTIASLERAYQEFTGLQDYKKSPEKASESLYRKAGKYYNLLRYRDALELYHQIEDYNNVVKILENYAYLENILSAAKDGSAAVWLSDEVKCSQCGQQGRWTYEFYANGSLKIYFECPKDNSHKIEISEKYKIEGHQFYISNYINGTLTWKEYGEIKTMKVNQDTGSGTNTEMSLELKDGTKLKLSGNIIADDNITFSSEA